MSDADGRPNNPIYSRGNRLKLGIFCTNTLSALTTVPELYKPTWQECLSVGQQADAMGLEAIVPIARWKGYLDGRFDHPTNEVLDTFTYAAAMAQATRHAAIFATTHAPTVHPIVIAKQSATIDTISGGRFCMNVVGGWNRREFDMFGIDLLEHGERYEYLAEWLGVVRKLWTATEEFDHQSRFFKMKNAMSRPQPLQKPTIPIMNAGLSASGMKFAAQHSDIGLITLFGPDPASWARQIADYKKLASSFGRTLQVWTNVMVTVRDTKAEAEKYLRRYSEEYLDGEAVDSFLATLSRENNIPEGSDQHKFMRRNISIGLGAPIVGAPQDVAENLRTLSEAGLDGAIMTYVDFADGLARFAKQVMPLLEAAGLRRPFLPDRH